MPTLNPQKLDDQESPSVWRPGPQPDHSPVRPVPSTSTTSTTPTTPTSHGPTIRSQRLPRRSSSCQAAQASCELAAIDPHSDPGRRLMWIMVAWFCTCLVAMMLLWNNVDTGGGWSEPLSGGYHDGGFQNVATSDAAG